MMRKKVVLTAIVLAVWLPVGSARATNYAAAPEIAWLASSLPTSSKVDLAKVATIDSPGRKQWAASGACAIKKNALATTKAGRCRVAVKVAASAGYSAASSSTTLQVAKSSELNVLVASSLTTAFTDLGSVFMARYLNVSVKFNFAGSSTLATQIQQGAPADLVVMADTANMDKLVTSNIVASGDVTTLVNNKLAILVARGNPAKIASLADLTKSGLKVVLCDVSQPCGKYAATVLGNAKVTLAPASREASASAVVSRVATGEADAGIAYITDGLVAGDKVDPVAIPESLNVVATYPIASLKAPSSRDTSAIAAFLAMARGAVGDSIFAKAGFIVP